MVLRGRRRTAGIPNQAVALFDDRHLIARIERGGSSWYELTHDRLIEPIRQSNRLWSRRRAARLSLLFVPIVLAAVALGCAEYYLRSVRENASLNLVMWERDAANSRLINSESQRAAANSRLFDSELDSAVLNKENGDLLARSGQVSEAENSYKKRSVYSRPSSP